MPSLAHQGPSQDDNLLARFAPSANQPNQRPNQQQREFVDIDPEQYKDIMKMDVQKMMEEEIIDQNFLKTNFLKSHQYLWTTDSCANQMRMSE